MSSKSKKDNKSDTSKSLSYKPITKPLKNKTPALTSANFPNLPNKGANNDISKKHNTLAAITHPPTMLNSINQQIPPTSYAGMANKEPTLDKTHAIVIPTIDGVRQLEYVEKIAEFVNPQDIKAAYRMSNQRFCIFFSSKQIVDNIVDQNRVLTINNHTINIRRLINPAKRIIISHVCPSIPTEVIEDELKKLNILPLSPITTMRAGFTSSALAHILTNKKQFYVVPESVALIPDSLVITHDDTTYRIFLAEEGTICYRCKHKGHVAAQCSEPVIADNKPQSTDVSKVLPSSDGSEREGLVDVQAIKDGGPSVTVIPPSKRAISSSTSSSSIETIPEKNLEKRVPTPKRFKSTEDLTDKLLETIKGAKEEMNENPDLYDITSQQFEDIMLAILTETNYIDAVKQMDIDPEKLINSLPILKNFILGQGAKNKLTRLVNSLSSNISGSETDLTNHD